MTSRVTSKYQTVLPKPLRQQFNIAPGSVLDWIADGDSLRVVTLSLPETPPPSALERKTCTGKELAAALRKFKTLTTAKDRRKMAEGVERARRHMKREHLH